MKKLKLAKLYDNKGYLLWLLSITPLLLFFINRNNTPGFDWNYFNSLNLVTQNYFKDLGFPVIDLKICGGYDLAANPQSSIFSPLTLFLLFLNPYMANLVSIVFMSMISFVFMVKTIKKHETFLVSYLGATIFCLAPFFSLHFAEGHIPYRSFYLLPVLYYLLVENFNMKNAHSALLIGTFSLMDGGMYFLFFFTFFYVFHIIINYKNIDKYKVLFTKKTLFLLCGSLLVILAKIYPLLALHGNRQAIYNNGTFGLYDLVNSLFNIFLTNLDTFGNFPYRAHEYAHYVTISLVTLFILVLFKEKKINKNIIYFLFSFWIFTGWGGVFNPWTILKIVPLLKNAHVQSRFSIFVFFFLIMIVSRGKIPNKVKIVLMIFAIAELLFQNSFVFNRLWSGYTIPITEYQYKKIEKIRNYSNYIMKPAIYNENKFSHSCYEPAQKHILMKRLSLFGEENSNIEISQESMKSLVISSTKLLPEKLLLNYKFNGGWHCNNCEVYNQDGLVFLENIGTTNKIIITYAPFYMPFIIGSYIMGLIVLVFGWRKE